MWPRLRHAAEELQLVFGERTHTYNSRNACEAAKWAEQQGRGWAFHQAVYEAYFVTGQNIALPHVLQEAAEKAGLAPERIPQLLGQGEFAPAVDADWTRCASKGVRAVPTIDNGNRQQVGFHSQQALLDFLDG